MKNLLLIVVCIASTTAFAATKAETVTLANDTGCKSIQTQQMRLRLTSIAMNPETPEQKERAVRSIVAISNDKNLCAVDLVGKYKVIDQRQNYVRVLVGKSKLWVLR